MGSTLSGSISQRTPIFGAAIDAEEEVEASLVTQSAHFDSADVRLEALQTAINYCPIQMNLVVAGEQNLRARDGHIIE